MLDHKVNMLYTVFLSFFNLTRRIFSIIFNEAVFFFRLSSKSKKVFFISFFFCFSIFASSGQNLDPHSIYIKISLSHGNFPQHS